MCSTPSYPLTQVRKDIADLWQVYLNLSGHLNFCLPMNLNYVMPCHRGRWDPEMGSPSLHQCQELRILKNSEGPEALCNPSTADKTMRTMSCHVELYGSITGAKLTASVDLLMVPAHIELLHPSELMLHAQQHHGMSRTSNVREALSSNCSPACPGSDGHVHRTLNRQIPVRCHRPLAQL